MNNKLSQIKSILLFFKEKFRNWKFYVEQNERAKFGVVAGFIVLVSAVSIYKYNSDIRAASSTNKTSIAILHALADMNNQLQDLSQNPNNTKKQQVMLQTISSNVEAIKKSVADIAQKSDIQKVSSQLTSMKDDVNIQMNDIKKSVSEGLGNKQYLDPSALPFHVISVDVISGQSYVSVNYANHVDPLGVSDLLAGWRLISADFDASSAEFVNEKNQYVKVNLQG